MPHDRIELLPFRIRLARLASVLDVAVDAPELERLRARAIDLGDYDFSAGVPPDLSWSASRITAWVGAIEPVCDSVTMKARFPALPAMADQLIEAAWGRAATADDLAAVEEGLATISDENERYKASCLAILSALELVAR